MNRTKTFTAAAALVLALGGGVVGGTLAVAGIAGGSQPATTTLERVNEEDNTMPRPEPTATPDVDSLESELGYPAETVEAEPAPVAAPEPQPTTPIVRNVGETPSEAADRARREADRAKVEADRAETVASPKPAPAVETPQPTPPAAPSTPEPAGPAPKAAPKTSGAGVTGGGSAVRTAPRVEAPAPAQSSEPEDTPVE